MTDTRVRAMAIAWLVLSPMSALAEEPDPGDETLAAFECAALASDIDDPANMQPDIDRLLTFGIDEGRLVAAAMAAGFTSKNSPLAKVQPDFWVGASWAMAGREIQDFMSAAVQGHPGDHGALQKVIATTQYKQRDCSLIGQ